MNAPRISLVTIIASIFALSGCDKPGKTDPEPSTGGSSATSEETIDVAFGVYSADKPTDVVKQFRSSLDALETSMASTLGKPVKISLDVSATYEGSINDLVTGKIQFSRLGPASYVTATDKNSDLKLLAMEGKKGKKVFKGIICVPRDSTDQSLADLKGKSFAFGDELSTIGRFLSQRALQEAGVKAADLASYEYLGRHDAVGAAVGAGKYDAGALKESAFKKLVDSGTPIRELVNFPNVTKPWVAHPSLSEEIYNALQKALFELDDPKALDDLGVDQLLEASDDDYAPTREAMKENSKFFE